MNIIGRNSLLRIRAYDGRELVTIDMSSGAIDLHDALDADLRQAAQLFWGAVHTAWTVAKGHEPLRDIVMLAGLGLGGDAGDIIIGPGNGYPGEKGGDVTIEAANLRPKPLAIASDEEQANIDTPIHQGESQS